MRPEKLQPCNAPRGQLLVDVLAQIGELGVRRGLLDILHKPSGFLVPFDHQWPRALKGQGRHFSCL